MQEYWWSFEILQRRAGEKGPLAARLDFCHGLLALKARQQARGPMGAAQKLRESRRHAVSNRSAPPRRFQGPTEAAERVFREAELLRGQGLPFGPSPIAAGPLEENHGGGDRGVEGFEVAGHRDGGQQISPLK